MCLVLRKMAVMVALVATEESVALVEAVVTLVRKGLYSLKYRPCLNEHFSHQINPYKLILVTAAAPSRCSTPEAMEEALVLVATAAMVAMVVLALLALGLIPASILT